MHTDGYIKLHRSMLEWEWFSDHNTRAVFIYMLMAANYVPKKWKGITVERGQLITSVSKLAESNGLTARNVRTALANLQSTGEVTIKATNRHTVVTVTNYGKYQDGGDACDKQNDKPHDKQTTNKRQTNDNDIRKKEYKNNNNKTARAYVDFYSKNIGIISPSTVEEAETFISDGMADEVLVMALKEAVDSGAKNWKYAKAVLTKWLEAGAVTPDKAMAAQVEYKRRREGMNGRGNALAYKKAFEQREYTEEEKEQHKLDAIADMERLYEDGK